MWELGGLADRRGRVMLGLGVWWEPIAGWVSVRRERPLQAMRKHIEAAEKFAEIISICRGLGKLVDIPQSEIDRILAQTIET